MIFVMCFSLSLYKSVVIVFLSTPGPFFQFLLSFDKKPFFYTLSATSPLIYSERMCVCVDVCVLVAKKEPSCARIEMMENYLNWGAEKRLHLIASGDSFLELSSSCVLVRGKRNQL